MKDIKVITLINKLNNYLLLGLIFLLPSFFVFNGQISNIFVLDKLILFRVIISLVLVLSVIKFFWQTEIKFLNNRLLFWLILFLLASWLVSTIFSLNPFVSWWGGYFRQLGIFSLLYYLLLFFLIIINFNSWFKIKQLIMMIVLGSIFPCCYGLIQLLGLDPVAYNGDEFRLFSTLGQPNFFGYYLIFVVPLTVYFLIYLVKKFWLKFIIHLLVCFQLICLIFTYSRGAWVGLLIGMIVGLALWLWAKGKKKLVIFSLLVGLFVLLLLVVNLKNISNQAKQLSEKINNPVAERVLSLFYLDNGSNEIRFIYWQSAWSEIEQVSWFRKLFGYGKDTQAFFFIKHYKPDWATYERIGYYPDRVHNLLLDTWLELGLVGVIAYCGLFIYLLSLALKDLVAHNYFKVFVISSLVGQIVANLFSFGAITHYLYWYLFLALLIIPHNLPSSSFNINRFSSIIKFIIIISLSFFVIFFCYYFGIKQYQADIYYAKAKHYNLISDCSSFVDNMEQAIITYPTDLHYKNEYLRLAISCIPETNNKQLTYNLLAQIESLESYKILEYNSLLYIAQAYSYLGYYDDDIYFADAEKVYQRLINETPDVFLAYSKYSKMLLWAEKYNQAIEVAKQGLNTIPDYRQKDQSNFSGNTPKKETFAFYETIADAYFSQGKYDLAIEKYLEIYNVFPQFINIYKKIADAYYFQGNLNQAIEYNQRASRLEPSNYKWFYNLATLYQEQQDLVQAQTYIKQAIQLAPNDPQVQLLYHDLLIN